MTKQMVQYKTVREFEESYGITVGQRALVIPIDHPNQFGLVDNGHAAWTTTVLWWDANTGHFETKNSHYVPAS